MAIEIVAFSFADAVRFRTFLKLPRKLYARDPYWVPELLIERAAFHNPKKNPIHAHLDTTYFLALKDGVPVGRITGHVNHAHNAAHHEQVGFFGFFESPNDPEIAGALFDAAADSLRARGLTAMRGPANFSSNEEWGALQMGFDDPPCVMMLYNPRYHIDLYQGAGFSKAMDLFAYDVVPNERTERIFRLAKRVPERAGVNIRPVRTDRAHWAREVEIIRTIYNAAWEQNWGFVPMGDAEFTHTANEMRGMLDPAYCSVAEDRETGAPVGFSVSLPDVHQILRHTRGRLVPTLWHFLVKKSQFRYRGIITRVRIITLGVIPQYRRRGIEAAFYARNFETAMTGGWGRGEISWLLENNVEMNNGAKQMGAKHYKTYRIWERPL